MKDKNKDAKALLPLPPPPPRGIPDKKEVEKDKKPDKPKDNSVDTIDGVLKKNTKLKIGMAILLFLSITIVGFLIYLKTNIDITETSIITALSFSILFNFFVILILVGTKMGQEIVGRLKRRFLFGSGRYVNTLYISKNGTIKEVFKKVDNVTGSFKIHENTFVRNPSFRHHYKNIPTYLHIEGKPDPVNVFQEGLTGDLSNAEIDVVMMSKGAFDFKQWLQKNATILFFVVVAVVAVGAVSAYLGFTNMQMLQDGTYAAVQCIKPVAEIAAATVL